MSAPLLTAIIAAALSATPAGEAPAAPAVRQPTSYRLNGVTVPDPYLWLEDGSSAAVQSWVREQDHYARRLLAGLPTHDALVARFSALFHADSVSPPVHRGGRYFYERILAAQDKASLVWRDGEAGAEHVLLDPNSWEEPTTALGAWFVSPDGRSVAWLAHPHHADAAELRVIDVETGEERPRDRIGGATWASPDWTADGGGFFYEWAPTDPQIPQAELPGHIEIRYHTLGDDPHHDATFFPKTGDPTALLHNELTADGRFLVTYVQHGWSAVDVYLREPAADGGRADAPWTPFFVGRPSVTRLDAAGGDLYVYTNDGAPRYRIFLVDPAHPAPTSWRLIVPEDPTATLDDWSLVGGALGLSYQKDGVSALRLVSPRGVALRSLALPGIGAASRIHGRPDEDEAYFVYSSFTSPPEIHRISVQSGDDRTWARTGTPVDPTLFEVEAVEYPSRDGTSVPMFLVHAKGLRRDGHNPTLLYAYGGFSVPMTPAFRPSILPWLEAGGVYALAGVRGGGERGEEWHQGGMLATKQHSFDDAIAAAEHLIREGWTRPEQLGVMGGSNGGLLVGAVVTQRPDLWGAAVLQAPLLDMLRYTGFGAGRTWIPEYGDPADATDFEWLHAWSPYRRIVDGTAYPAILLESPANDDRVDPMHARKFAAAVQHATSGGAPVLLRVESEAGHTSAQGGTKSASLQADTYAFLWDRLHR